MGGGGEEGVALPTTTARGDHRLLTVLEDLCHDLTGVEVAQNRPRRHGHDDVGAGSTALVRPHPVLATLGQPPVAVGVVEESGEVRVAADDDAAAAATVAAVGAAHRRPPFAAEGGASRSAGAALDF